MKKRRKYILYSLIFLLAGVICYGLFRSGTYLHRFLPPAIVLQGDFPLKALFSCYLPDFFWCGSLSFGLFALWLPEGKSRFLWAGVAALSGIAWELAQYTGLLSGTGDIIDCLLYIMGASVPILIKKKERIPK